jgi:hypothetical protein
MAPMMAAWVMYFVFFMGALLLGQTTHGNKRWAQSAHPEKILVLFTDRMVSNCPIMFGTSILRRETVVNRESLPAFSFTGWGFIL